MDYSVDTPFSSYQEIQEAVRTNKVTLSYDRGTAYNISCAVKPISTIANIIIPIISVILMFIACQYFSVSKWFLLFGIVVLLINTLVPHLKGFFWLLAIALIALPFVYLHNSMWMVVIGVGIVGMLIGYYIWWGIISGIASKAIMSDEELFESVWKAKKVALRTDNTMNGFYTYGTGELKKKLENLNT